MSMLDVPVPVKERKSPLPPCPSMTPVIDWPATSSAVSTPSPSSTSPVTEPELTKLSAVAPNATAMPLSPFSVPALSTEPCTLSNDSPMSAPDTVPPLCTVTMAEAPAAVPSKTMPEPPAPVAVALLLSVMVIAVVSPASSWPSTACALAPEAEKAPATGAMLVWPLRTSAAAPSPVVVEEMVPIYRLLSVLVADMSAPSPSPSTMPWALAPEVVTVTLSIVTEKVESVAPGPIGSTISPMASSPAVLIVV